jgi:FkbM family methyltransferase
MGSSLVPFVLALRGWLWVDNSFLGQPFHGGIMNRDLLISMASQYIDNGEEVVDAHFSKSEWPPLQLKSGIVVEHRKSDPIALLFFEIFLQRAYTGKTFYIPRMNDVILDCGANIGLFAFYLISQEERLTIHCFEPNKDNFTLLQSNITRNGLQDRIKAHPFAILDRRGRGALRTYVNSSSSGTLFSLTRPWPTATEEVQFISLRDAVEIAEVSQIDFLKIDTEGAEIEILTAACETGQLDLVQRVVLETHDYMRLNCMDQCLSVLVSSGFSTFQRSLKGTSNPQQLLFGIRANVIAS